jgi:acyl carrier protein
VDAERVMAFLRDGLPYQPIANYIERKLKNPSARAINEMYAFLEHKGMPLTPKGTFIAYKGVQSDWYSLHANKDTVVLKGKVNEQGQILNTVGETIEVERSSVDDDFRQGCSFGLHAGSLAYASGWGARVVLVDIDPTDVVSVPEDCNCQKLRCCKYTVIGEYTGPMPDTYTDEFSPRETVNQDGVKVEECSECNGFDCDCDCDGGTSCPDGCDCEDCHVAEVLTENKNSESSPNVSMKECADGNCGCESCQCNECQTQTNTCQHCGAQDCYCERNLESDPEITSDKCSHCQHAKDACICNDIEKRIISIFSQQFGYSEKYVKPTQTCAELGADSLDKVELWIAMEDEFSVEIPDEIVEKYESATVGEIIKGIKEYLSSKNNKSSIPANPCEHGFGVGMTDRLTGKYATYVRGDENAADSNQHHAYILGYLDGYAKS